MRLVLVRMGNTARHSWILLLAALILCQSCGPKKETILTYGVDLSKLRAQSTDLTPDVRSELNDVAFGIRYEDPARALNALEKLGNTPGATKSQKKAVNATIKQVKKLSAEKPPQPTQ
jgi:hypothetical protein